MVSRHILTYWLSLQTLTCFSTVLAQEVDRPNGEITSTSIAVLELSAPDISASGRAILTDLIRQELLKGEGITLIDRLHIEEVLTERDLQDLGLLDEATLKKTGKLMGAEKIVSGQVGNLGDLYMITLQMLDVETGQIIRLVEESYTGPVERLTIPIRASAQRLLGIGGEGTLKPTLLRIASTPAGARVYVDDLFEGNTPLMIKMLDPGVHNVKMTAPGYAGWEQSVDIVESETNFIDAELIELLGDESAIDLSGWQDGRKSLLIFSCFYTIWLIDGSLAALGVESERPYKGGFYVGAPIGFFTALNLTKNKPVTRARTAMIISSTLWGTMWGVSAAGIMKPKTLKPFYTLSLIGGNIALYMSVDYTAKHNITSGRVFLVNLGSFLGTLLGLGTPYLLNVENEKVYLASLIAGGISGGYYAFKLTKRFDEIVPGYTDNSKRMQTLNKKREGSSLALVPVIASRLPNSQWFDSFRKSDDGFYLGLQLILY